MFNKDYTGGKIFLDSFEIKTLNVIDAQLYRSFKDQKSENALAFL